MGASAMAMNLKSPAFKDDGEIPHKYTCNGSDVSPPLRWEGAPPEARSFALISEDLDAPGGTWVHWIVYDLPPEARELQEGIPSSDTLPNRARQGLNDYRKVGYGGPCPPPDPAHRYLFKLYALDSRVKLKPRATKQELLDAMKGHIVAETQLVGRYKR